ncbi:MAG: sulfatase-like hydrolase/transferase [Phycisphaera sp.]|nr:sulfatase-like hydrolase/transferase [Phycisphaera sp.]
MPERPNILFILTDQQRADTVAALGNPIIKTPALDRLANHGVAFTSAYSPSPVCVPARCCLHYGQYPMNTGCYDNAWPMPTDRPSFMQALTDSGYRTHGIGKCHFTPDAKALRGFQSRESLEEVPRRDSDDYTHMLEEQGWGELPEPHGVRGEMYYVPQVSQLPAKLHPTQWVGDRSVDFIEKQKKTRQPWMLYSSYVHPHPPFAPPWPWHKLYRSFNLPLPHVPHEWESLLTYINRNQNRYKGRDQGIDRNLLRNIKAHYYACISFVDYQVGRLLDALDATGQRDNTLILFSSDHGELLGDFNSFGKRSMHDACARVPMLASLPGRFEGGRRCHKPVSLVDIMPTFLAAAGVESKSIKTDGVDLADTLNHNSDRKAVHAQYRCKGTAIYTTVTEDWKYAYSAPDQKEFLFSRKQDPIETRNYAGLPDSDDTLERLRTMTLDWLKSSLPGGESTAYEGDDWKVYPKLEVSPDPNQGLLTQDRPGYVLDLPGYSD